MVSIVLVGLAAFVLGVVLTALFGVKIANSAISGEKALLAEARTAAFDSEGRIKSELAVVEKSVHDKLDALKADLVKDVGKV